MYLLESASLSLFSKYVVTKIVRKYEIVLLAISLRFSFSDYSVEWCSTQIIDRDGTFNVDGPENFSKDVELSKCGVSYAVVSILGPQSSCDQTLATGYESAYAKHFLDCSPGSQREKIWEKMEMFRIIQMIRRTPIYVIKGLKLHPLINF